MGYDTRSTSRVSDVSINIVYMYVGEYMGVSQQQQFRSIV
jgi:hypothetical protein